MRNDSRYRPRPDRSEPPRGDPTRAEIAVAAALLLGFAVWIAVVPAVLYALLVSVAAALSAVILPLAVIHAVAGLDAFNRKVSRTLREWLIQREGDETTPGEATVTEQ